LPRPRPNPIGDSRRRLRFLLTLAIACLATACPNGSEPAGPAAPAGGVGGGGAGGGAPVCGNGVVETGELCDDGNIVSGDGCSSICEVEAGAGSSAVRGIESFASPREGATLRMPSYTAPANGLLLVRIGARGSVSQSVTFAGRQMMHVSSMEVTYFDTLSTEMFYLPVLAGESGAIAIDYGFSGTDEKGLIAATLVGVTRLASVQTYTDGEVTQANRIGPNLAQAAFATPASGVVMSGVTILGAGIPAIVGAGHDLDGYPTVPESDYHQSKVLAGHVLAPSPGTYTLGYQNTRPTGYMDYAMIIASFAP